VVVTAAAAFASGAAVVVPENDGWVTDRADFLTPEQERSLEALMGSYESGSGHEIALLTVPDLGGEPIERYALDVARAWGIGKTDTQAGALLVIARRGREIRIEVGRGLEGTLTDSISGRIIRNVIAPDFKQGRFYDGIRAGIEAMHAAAGGEYGAIPGDRERKRRSVGTLVPLIWILLVILSIVRRRRRGSRGGILPWIVLGGSGGGRSSGGGGFGGFGGGGGFSGGGASGGW